MREFNPFPQTAPDFSDPLGLLRACHGRIVAHCDTLERVLPHLRENGADNEAAQAMARIHRYFSTSAQHHHEDEERDLFPRLRGRSMDADRIMGELEREHRDLAQRWHALAGWLTEPLRAATGIEEFTPVANQFVTGYRAHVMKENEGILLLAADLLHPEARRLIGASMALRRNVSTDFHSQ